MINRIPLEVIDALAKAENYTRIDYQEKSRILEKGETCEGI